MSSAEERLPKSSSDSAKQPALKAPPQRPILVQPPKPPAAVAPAAKEPVPAPAPTPTVQPEPVPAPPIPSAPQPISPPSEPMQYRAIGLVRGTYRPKEDEFNRGDLITEEGTEIDSVLLGRITSLVKKHVDLAAPHLWVVYPRTRQSEETLELDLHLQIVGVWEPETLGLPGENPEAVDKAAITDADSQESESALSPAADTPASAALAPAPEDPTDGYFSIRGEVIKCDEDDDHVVIKIVQGAKRGDKSQKAFRVHVKGMLSGKTVGYFWELDVQRQGRHLMLVEGRTIGIVPPRKRKKRSFGGSRRPQGNRPRPGGSAPSKEREKPKIRPTAPVRSNPL